MIKTKMAFLEGRLLSS